MTVADVHELMEDVLLVRVRDPEPLARATHDREENVEERDREHEQRARAAATRSPRRPLRSGGNGFAAHT